LGYVSSFDHKSSRQVTWQRPTPRASASSLSSLRSSGALSGCSTSRGALQPSPCCASWPLPCRRSSSCTCPPSLTRWGNRGCRRVGAQLSAPFLQIWVALRDLKDYVREAAAEAVGACLQLVAERENGSLLLCYDKTFEEAQMVRGLVCIFLLLPL